MKISENVYQLTGHVTGLNSNTFVIDTEDGLVMIDTGYREYYVETMKKQLRFWHLDQKKVAAVFITHGHFDHSGNAHIFEEQGIHVYASEIDANAMEHGGDRVMEPVFGTKYTCCRHVNRLVEGKIYTFGTTTITPVSLPGHTKGSVGFVTEHDGVKTLFLGDLFMVSGASPADEVEVEIGYTGSVDYDREANLNSLKSLMGLDVDIVAPGHRGVFYGDSRTLFGKVYETALKTI